MKEILVEERFERVKSVVAASRDQGHGAESRGCDCGITVLRDPWQP